MPYCTVNINLHLKVKLEYNEENIIKYVAETWGIHEQDYYRLKNISEKDLELVKLYNRDWKLVPDDEYERITKLTFDYNSYEEALEDAKETFNRATDIKYRITDLDDTFFNDDIKKYISETIFSNQWDIDFDGNNCYCNVDEDEIEFIFPISFTTSDIDYNPGSPMSRPNGDYPTPEEPPVANILWNNIFDASRKQEYIAEYNKNFDRTYQFFFKAYDIFIDHDKFKLDIADLEWDD